MEENDFTKKLPKIIIICSIIIAALSAYILLTNDLADKPLAGKGDNFQGQADIGGDFTLTNQDGEEFGSKQMKGHISLVYFGFTFCPDICPTSLQKLAMVIDVLEKYKIDILPIFITVDPQRDKAEGLKQYLSHFHPKIVGLTGDQQSIKKVAELYKVYYAIAENHDQAEDRYMIDHSSFIYLMDRNGKYHKHFYLSNTVEEIIDYIRINHKSL